MKIFERRHVPVGVMMPDAWLSWGRYGSHQKDWYCCLRLPLFSHESRYDPPSAAYKLGWWIPVIAFGVEWRVVEYVPVETGEPYPCETRCEPKRKRITHFWVGHEMHGSMASPEDQLERRRR